jgi:protoheme IX farnesyltransferase
VKPRAYSTLPAAAAHAAPVHGVVAVARDWLTLVRPRIAVFVVLAALTGALLSTGQSVELATAVTVALLVGAVAASSSVFNQILERDTDRLMERTADRPLATGRISVRDATCFAAGLALVGTLGLAVWFNVLAALLGLSTLLAYVLVYTPMKRHTSLNTVIGALPGAMPPLLGAVAMTGSPGVWGWTLFAFVFVWQFPHFFAIAWLYREDYRRAGMKMLASIPGGEAMAGRQAFVYSLLILPISLLPVIRGEAGALFFVVTFLLSLGYVGFSAAFAWRVSHRSSRALLLFSLLYLPLTLSVALFDPVVQSLIQSS